jgi:4a-hydroxytetrahydrobiopterin dehydratase
LCGPFSFKDETMSDDLKEKTCTPCQGGIPPLGPTRARELLASTPGWSLLDEARRLEKHYRFGNFREALDFVLLLGELSEQQGHHPDISFGWGWATVSWQTKKIKGLHENDFIMAAKTDILLSGRDDTPSRS